MKELNFEQMEKIQGGKMAMSYCELLGYWLRTGDGYQGSMGDLASAYYNNCYGA